MLCNTPAEHSSFLFCSRLGLIRLKAFLDPKVVEAASKGFGHHNNGNRCSLE